MQRFKAKNKQLTLFRQGRLLVLSVLLAIVGSSMFYHFKLILVS